jgi:hypothetical protein
MATSNGNIEALWEIGVQYPMDVTALNSLP